MGWVVRNALEQAISRRTQDRAQQEAEQHKVGRKEARDKQVSIPTTKRKL